MKDDLYYASKMEDDVFLYMTKKESTPTWLTSQDAVRKKHLRKIKYQIRCKTNLHRNWMLLINDLQKDIAELQDEAQAIEASIAPVQIIETPSKRGKSRAVKIGDTVITKEMAEAMQNSSEFKELMAKFIN